MCFSVYTLKSVISIGIAVTLLLGIALLYVLVYAFVISSVSAQIQTDFRNIFIGAFLASSILMIFSSLAGIYGLIRKINQCVIIYAATMFIYFVAFLLVAIFIIVYPGQLLEDCSQEYHNQYKIAVDAANKTLCKTCQCNFYNQQAYNESDWRVLKQMGFNNISLIYNDSLPVNAQNCQTWNNNTYSITGQLVMIQSFFNCSGWCTLDSQYNLYYLFTNVNNGKPSTSCVSALLGFFNSFGLVLEISSFIVSGILFIILINILCLCCHPQRSNQYDAIKFFRNTFNAQQHQSQLS